MCANQTKDIINYWSAMEQLSPYKINTYAKKCSDVETLESVLNKNESGKDDRKYFAVYIGSSLVSEVLKLIDSDKENSEIEKLTDETPACSFLFDEEINYVAGSFMISPFLWSLLNIVNENFDAIFWYESFQRANQCVETTVVQMFAGIDESGERVKKAYDLSQKILDIILIAYKTENAMANNKGFDSIVNDIYEVLKNTLIGILVDNASEILKNFLNAVADKGCELFKKHFSTCSQKVDANETFINLFRGDTLQREKTIVSVVKIKGNNEDSGMLGSFFMKDMANLYQLSAESELTSNVESYIQMSVHPKKQRVDNDVEEMTPILSAENFPLGMFPSKHSPSLMQQIAINLARQHIKSDDNSTNQIFSVNGPPGTGKTTLLKEIVASNVVERAIVLSQMDPGEAFPDNGGKKTVGCVKTVDAKDKEYENWCYKFPEELLPYGMLVASSNNAAVENISMELPKSIGVNSRTCFFADNFEGDNFFSDVAANVIGNEKSIGMLSAKLGNKENIGEFKNKFWFGNDSSRDNKEADIQVPIQKINSSDDNNEKSDHKAYMKGIFSNFKHEEKPDWDDAIAKFNEALEKVEACRGYIDNAQQRQIQSAEYAIKIDQMVFDENYVDEKFWEDITQNVKSQVACPWTYPGYDKLREELFYRALMLHKAFLMNCERAWLNLNALMYYWSNNKTVDGKVYPHLLNTLFLFVPVISTTFASVQSFLKGIDKNQLGTLIIDEAGQAVPHAALGALWRTQKAIVVGDPLQIEPVVPVPVWLLNKVAKKMGVSQLYTSTKLSVQTFADAMNPYIGKLNNMEVGCPLVVHRRCNNPMFAISNFIAYGNRMIYQSNKPQESMKFIFPKSGWQDIDGDEKGCGDHTVMDQIDFVVRKIILGSFIDNDTEKIYEFKLPDLFVISPFKTVINSIKHYLHLLFPSFCSKLNCYCNSCAFGEGNPEAHLKCEVANKFNKWIESHCGTVHTFQGKEANEVVLVLGCDSTAQGAMNWVVSSPNILNVAVSRAKYRLVVVASRKLWCDCKYTVTVSNKLNSLPIYANEEFPERCIKNLSNKSQYKRV